MPSTGFCSDCSRSAKRWFVRSYAAGVLIKLGDHSQCEALVRELRSMEVGGTGFLPWLARETQRGATSGSAARLAIVAVDEKDLRQKLAAAVEALSCTPDAAIDLPDIHIGVGSPARGLAYLFAGQGSQYPGMGAGLALLWPAALAAWDLAADLPLEAAVRLQQLVFPPPAFTDEQRARQEQRLRRTEWAQPALAAASLMRWRVERLPSAQTRQPVPWLTLP
jgi:acyl transferase domain-containing protein